MFSKNLAQISANIEANFAKNVTKNFKKSPNLVTLIA